MEASLLVELLTEELPPKALSTLGLNFADSIREGLVSRGLVAKTNAQWKWFATPRRLAFFVPRAAAEGVDLALEIRGPSVSAPAAAIAGFAKRNGVQVSALRQQDTPKGKIVVAKTVQKGASLKAVLPEIVADALKKLPIPKLMRWGAGDAQFVRPAHGLVLLHGEDVVPGKVLGLESGRSTKGHRFMGKSDITLANADEYEKALLDKGMVLADFEKRKSEIDRQLQVQAEKQNATLGEYQILLDEVAALVEHSTVYVGEFDKAFLEVPQECLILTMRQNQKYFPLFDAAGRLLPKFLIVSNMQLANPRHIIGGNQRVVRARLEDARFFYNQDRKLRLEARVPLLEKVVYHNKLGNQLQRVERVQLLSGKIARALKCDAALAERAAWLAKADLLTGMVGEFPELQGTMGRYYAAHDGEPAAVADAIETHYRPRFAGDRLPEGPVACAVALGEKLDAIAGMFSIGQQPTGDKDPFGLRRAALGVVRILVENKLALSLTELVNAAFEPYKGKAIPEVVQFVYDRFAGYLKELGFTTLQIDAVLCMNPTSLAIALDQLTAVKAFQTLPEAESLAAANKRIVNILKQAAAKGESFANAEAGELKEPAERALHEAIRVASQKAKPLYEKGDYTGYLKSFSVLKAPVDTFFEKVMVMVEDKKLRHERLALLKDLRDAMNRVADISRLAA